MLFPAQSLEPVVTSTFLDHVPTLLLFQPPEIFWKRSLLCLLSSLLLMAFYLFISLFLFPCSLRRDRDRCYVQLAVLIPADVRFLPGQFQTGICLQEFPL